MSERESGFRGWLKFAGLDMGVFFGFVGCWFFSTMKGKQHR